jgi:protein-tyrosine phosphatase
VVPARAGEPSLRPLPHRRRRTIDNKTRQVARLVADLVQGGHRVLVHCAQGLNRLGIVVARALMFLGYSTAEAIDLVRLRRGLDEGFGALGNERFVEWLFLEEAGMDQGPTNPDQPRSRRR